MADKFKAFCNRCNTTTNHTVKCEHKVDETIEADINGIRQKHSLGAFFYQIIECSGCETISYRTVDNFSTFLEINKQTGKPVISNNKTFETFYPERLKDTLIEKRIVGLPVLLRKAYREVIDSYNYDQRILCAGGLRAIVEGVCADRDIRAKFLKDRIDQLGSSGLISKELAESLKIHKLLGDYALHRLDIPEKEELESAIHFIELTLETIYSVPDKHHKLKETITKRVSKEN